MVAGLEGDFYDLFALLHWADEVIDYHTELSSGPAGQLIAVTLWTDDDKRAIIRAGLELTQRFRDMEKKQRQHFGLDVGKRERVQTGAQDFYDRYCADIYTVWDFVFPAPVSQDPRDIELWENNRRLRIPYGENGFGAWAMSKPACVDQILGMLKQKAPQFEDYCRSRLPRKPTIIYS